jgi:hypothetical protein
VTRAAQLLHGCTALLCCLALIVQYALVIGDLGVAFGSWRYFGFFTILTNLMVAIVSTATALRSGSPLASATLRHAALTSVLIVGITYSIALRSLWNPVGLQKLADIALHDLSPLLYLVAWVVAPHPGLRSAARWYRPSPISPMRRRGERSMAGMHTGFSIRACSAYPRWH